MAKTVFYLKKSKNNFLGSISSVFAFKQAKEQILFLVQPLKIINENFFWPHFRVTLNCFWGPATSEKPTIWHNRQSVKIYFQNHSTLMYIHAKNQGVGDSTMKCTL